MSMNWDLRGIGINSPEYYGVCQTVTAGNQSWWRLKMAVGLAGSGFGPWAHTKPTLHRAGAAALPESNFTKVNVFVEACPVVFFPKRNAAQARPMTLCSGRACLCLYRDGVFMLGRVGLGPIEVVSSCFPDPVLEKLLSMQNFCRVWQLISIPVVCYWDVPWFCTKMLNSFY